MTTEAQWAEWVKAELAKAPPLSPEQIRQIRALLLAPKRPAAKQ